MGFYIEGPSRDKVEYIIKEHGGELMMRVPQNIEEIDDDKAIVCVVDNIVFEAAVYIYSHNELVAFQQPDDHRRKTWLLMDKKKTQKLSGYNLD